MYIVQLYKEDWTILHMLGCWAIALPGTEQIVGPCVLHVAFENLVSFGKFLAITCFLPYDAGGVMNDTIAFLLVR